MTSIEYEVLTSVGAVLLQTPEHEIARGFVRERARKVPGLTLRIEEVITTVTRRRVGVRPQLKVVGG